MQIHQEADGLALDLPLRKEVSRSLPFAGLMSEHAVETTDRVEPVLVSEPADLTALEAEEVIEVPLLLSGREMSVLEQAAHQQGLTTGALLRGMLRDFVQQAVGRVRGRTCKPEAL